MKLVLIKLAALENQKVMDFVGQFADHCNPATIYVCDDSKKMNNTSENKLLQKAKNSF